jgi:predicted heme/steroid binding protein
MAKRRPNSKPRQSRPLTDRPGTDSSKPTYVAIKGTVFDVSSSSSYKADGPYKGISESHVGEVRS